MCGQACHTALMATYSRVALLVLLLLSLLPSYASAHQPRIVESRVTTVEKPDISKAYYAQLKGEPDVYTIEATEPFDLYVGVLVPDIEGHLKDVSAVILRDGTEVAVLDGKTFTWEKFFEPFGYDSYWKGPEYKGQGEAGTYMIRVWSDMNSSKYSLAVGEKEVFDVAETLNALRLIPQLKENFFNESPRSFIFSPLGWGLIVILYALAFIVGFVYRSVLRRFAAKTTYGAAHNIGTYDRWLRVVIGVVLLYIAVETTWSFVLIFFSGFCLFEAMFSWCGYYAAIGKNTCEA